jgi:nitroreductase
MPPDTPLDHILESARWAPSGDNAQPWRFERLDAETVRIHLTSEADHNPYDYRGGEPSLLSGGMLLESLRLAATRHGRRMTWSLHRDQDPWQIDAHFALDPQIAADPLCAVLQQRSVNRRSYRSRPLTAVEKGALNAALGQELAVVWHEPLDRRMEFARLGALATDIRLRAPETYAIHREVIDWTPGHSRTGLPAAALGLDRPTLLMMRWAMAAWSRLDRLNRLTGTWAAARQLDVATARGSAAFFTLEAPSVATGPDRTETLLRQGMAIQRFWLTATRLGLALQPGLAILIFAQYGADGHAFTSDATLRAKAGQLAKDFTAVLGRRPADVAFLGRIGEPVPGLPGVRSIRRRLSDLIYAG